MSTAAPTGWIRSRAPALRGVRSRLAVRGRTVNGWAPLAVAGFLLVGTRQAWTVPYTGLGLSPAQLILLVLCLVWVTTRFAGQQAASGPGLLGWLLVARLAVVLVSFGLSAGTPLDAAQRAAGGRTVVVEAATALLVVVVSSLVRTRRDLERVLQALVLGAALSGLFAVTEYATGVDVAARVHLPGLRETIPTQGADLVRGGLERVSGAAAQPLELAAVTTTLLPVAVALCFAGRRPGARAWPWALATALIAAGALVSLSRSVFVALAVAGVVVACRWPVRRTAAVAGAVVAAATVLAVSGSRVVAAIVTLLTQGSGDFSLGSREVGRAYAFSRLPDHLWWGQGPGTYDLSRQPVLDNQYLSHLVETGALGLVTSVAVLGCAVVLALGATGRAVEPVTRELAVGVTGALVVVLVVQLVLDTAGFVQISLLTWLCVGLAAACRGVAATTEVTARAAEVR